MLATLAFLFLIPFAVFASGYALGYFCEKAANNL
jgi:uncharacterized protein (UPF0333 family)